MSAAFSNLAVNQMGGEVEARVTIGDEFGLFTEFYQPIDYAQRYYVFANAGGGKYNRNVFDDEGRILSQARISQVYFQGGVGTNFGNWATLRFAMQRVSGTVKGRIGYPEDFKFPFDDTAFVTQFSVDTLDNVQFPHKGMVFDSEYKNSMSWLGGDGSVETVQFGAYHPFSWGKNTLGVIYQIGTSMNGTPDETDLLPQDCRWSTFFDPDTHLPGSGPGSG